MSLLFEVLEELDVPRCRCPAAPRKSCACPPGPCDCLLPLTFPPCEHVHDVPAHALPVERWAELLEQERPREYRAPRKRGAPSHAWRRQARVALLARRHRLGQALWNAQDLVHQPSAWALLGQLAQEKGRLTDTPEVEVGAPCPLAQELARAVAREEHRLLAEEALALRPRRWRGKWFRDTRGQLWLFGEATARQRQTRRPRVRVVAQPAPTLFDAPSWAVSA